MPELRHDPVREGWVIIATERARRPSDFKPPHNAKKGETNCPFCPGNEKKTPPEIMSFRAEDTDPDTPGWQVRVVPNKFAALTVDAKTAAETKGLFQIRAGTGVHEVIIEGPDHNAFFSDLDQEHAVQVLKGWRQRYLQLEQDEKLQYIQLFKNHGRTAGASLEHPHSQLIATSIIPPAVNSEIKRIKDYWQEKESCLFCDLINAELEAGARVISSNREFIALCPFASRFPLETWILPRRHQGNFGQCEDEQLQQLAPLLQEVLDRLRQVASDPPFNLVLHTPPLRQQAPVFHWRFELLPRLTIVAGFEWGTGMYINPTPPEIAAQFLKEAKIN